MPFAFRTRPRTTVALTGGALALAALLTPALPTSASGVSSSSESTPAIVTASYVTRSNASLSPREDAEDAIADANRSLARAEGKADASALTAALRRMGMIALVAEESVPGLTAELRAAISKTDAAVDAVEKKRAAEKRAAEQRAAEQRAAQERARQAQGSTQLASAGARPLGSTSPDAARAIGRQLAASRGWGSAQFQCLDAVWSRESGWNMNAYNPTSGAGGIPQALPASKMASAGADWQTNAATQITWGLNYIASRYGTPCGAWQTFQSRGWY